MQNTIRRKLVKQGQNALTVTLPKKWLTNQNLSAGDEVVIDIESDLLQVSISQKQFVKKEIELSLEGFSKSKLWHTLQNYYIKGYDVFVLSHTDVEKEEITSIGSQFLGMAIVSQSKTKTIMESLIATPVDSYEQLRKRIFFLLKEFATSSLKSGVSAKVVKKNEHNLDTHIRYALRYLTKYMSGSFYEDFLQFTTLEQLADTISLLKRYNPTQKHFTYLTNLIEMYVDLSIRTKYDELFSYLRDKLDEVRIMPKTFETALCMMVAETAYNFVSYVIER